MTFDINSVIQHFGLGPGENINSLAKTLFPNAKYPRQALDRVLRGEGELDIKQVETLASYLGVLLTDLFRFEDWKAISECDIIVLSKGEYTAKLNYKGVFLSIYKNSDLVEQLITNPLNMTVQDLIDLLNNRINLNEKDGNNQN